MALYIFFGARGIGANDASARVFNKNVKEVKNFVCCVALSTTIKEIKVENVAESAKIVTNVQTFRDCALHQWNVR